MSEEKSATDDKQSDRDGQGNDDKKLESLEARLKEVNEEAKNYRLKLREAEKREANSNSKVEALEGDLESLKDKVDGKLPEAEKKAKEDARQIKTLTTDNEKLKTSNKTLLGKYADVSAKAHHDLIAASVAEPYQEPARELLRIYGEVDPDTYEFTVQERAPKDWLVGWLDKKGDSARKPTAEKGGGGTKPTTRTGDKKPDDKADQKGDHSQFMNKNSSLVLDAVKNSRK